MHACGFCLVSALRRPATSAWHSILSCSKALPEIWIPVVKFIEAITHTLASCMEGAHKPWVVLAGVDDDDDNGDGDWYKGQDSCQYHTCNCKQADIACRGLVSTCESSSNASSTSV
jgi:hypothetical protein